LQIPGLVRFVTKGRDFAVVPDEEIESIRAVSRSEIQYEAGEFPALGQKVRIRGGCLEGVEGVLTSQTGRGELVVSIGAIQRALKFPIGSYRIESVT
jgi:transcription antitermination factor NusG